MKAQGKYGEPPGPAVLQIDRDSGEVLQCDAQAGGLLAAPAGGPVGRDWRELLGSAVDTPLAAAISAGLRTTLPPFLLQPPGGDETVVGGYVYPESGEGCRTVTLILFRLVRRDELAFSDSLAPGDVVVVLGVEPSRAEAARDPADHARMMMDVYAGLQQIVPAASDVALPRSSTIALLLRQLPVEQAVDIARAILSHLGPLLASQLRARIGLARREDESPLATLVAANAALMSLQHADSNEFIAVASERDQALLAARAAVGDGLFSASADTAEQQSFLAGLVAMGADRHRGEEYLGQVISDLLERSGVAAAAVYRRDREDGFRYIVGAICGEKGGHRVAEKELPRELRRFKVDSEELRQRDAVHTRNGACAVFPLKSADNLLGYLALHYAEASAAAPESPFAPGVAALHYLASVLSRWPEWRESGSQAAPQARPAPPPQEELEGYVADNMEGAIDQAVFLARVDVPVAVIGPRGTGKLYVARIIHQEWGGAPDDLVAIDCRAIRSRKEALRRIAHELPRAEGKTLVFKSPHLMHADAQVKLARQISTRVLADSQPPRYLPRARFVGLFPDSMEHLMRFGGLNEKLASVFAAYPVQVPPIRDRKRAVLRWAHKILAQEAGQRDRRVSGFTPDAEQAMLQHDWPGNISEMRQCICAALDKSDKEWLTPVDIGLFKGLSAEPVPEAPVEHPFLQSVMEPQREETVYSASPLDDLGVALGESLHSLLETGVIKPLGAWLDDELVLAVSERFHGNRRAAADFLHTRPRNIARWMPAIQERDQERGASALWQSPRQLIRQWVLECHGTEQPPQQLLQGMLLSHIQHQCDGVSVADRARIMGMSIPTYQKRLRELSGKPAQEDQS